MKKLLPLLMLALSSLCFSQTTYPVLTPDQSTSSQNCTMDTTNNVTCPQFQLDSQAGYTGLTTGNFDPTSGNFTAGTLSWTFQNDPTTMQTCSNFSGHWDWPGTQDKDLIYPTLLVGECVGIDSTTGNPITLDAVLFVNVYYTVDSNQVPILSVVDGQIANNSGN